MPRPFDDTWRTVEEAVRYAAEQNGYEFCARSETIDAPTPLATWDWLAGSITSLVFKKKHSHPRKIKIVVRGNNGMFKKWSIWVQSSKIHATYAPFAKPTLWFTLEDPELIPNMVNHIKNGTENYNKRPRANYCSVDDC